MVFLANYQIDLHFNEYLAAQQNGMGMMTVSGTAEQIFLDSIHRSLYWVGGAILLVGLFVSYTLVRSITVPLRKLSTALASLEIGRYGETAHIDSRSEVGDLADGFNRMSRSLAEAGQLTLKKERTDVRQLIHRPSTCRSLWPGNELLPCKKTWRRFPPFLSIPGGSTRFSTIF